MKAHNSIEMIGKTFNFLTVISETIRTHHKRPMYVCKCSCGSIKNVEGRRLREGTVKSCGCFAKESLKIRSVTHGMTYSAEYKTWCGMKRRCLNKNDKRYPAYGGRGIKICDSWLYSFESFFQDMGKKPKGFSIERKDVNGNYEHSNCEWIKISSQASNKRSNVKITHNNTTKNLCEWSLITGIKPGTISARIKSGWSIEKSLSIIPHYPRRTQEEPL